MLRTLPLYLLALLALVACRDELGLVDTTFDYADAYFILDEARPMTRTEYYADDIDTTAFTDGDVLGVFAIDQNGNAVSGEKANARYVVQEVPNIDGATVKVLRPADTGNTLSKGLRYLIYYPYNAGLQSVDQLKDYTHAVSTDQRGDRQASDLDFYDQNKNFMLSDLLWDIATQDPTDSRVHIVMDHAMAQFIVTMDDSHYKLDDGIDILNQPVKADHINLLADGIDAMNQSYRYQVDSEYDYQRDIHMWNFEYSRTGSRQFRAVLPACRTLAAGTEIFGATNRQGNHVTLRLKRDLTLRPGYNYRFDLNRKPTPLPEIGDDDSWVLDVLDPETGDTVGLLCREYIRYQPQTALSSNPDDNWKPDQITHPTEAREDLIVQQGEGTGVSYPSWGTLEGITISSQCWVFYNLQADKRTPDLSKGTIMRFIYDFRGDIKAGGTDAQAGQCSSAWPAPFTGGDIYVGRGKRQGIFATNHGHDWIMDPAGYGRSTYSGEAHPALYENGYYYEFCNDDAVDLGMHGGTIYWDGSRNAITHYEMLPENERVTNDVAYNYGHISIPRDGSKPFVSYSPLSGIYDDEVQTDNDEEKNKAGIIVPHYLVDFRGTGKQTEVNRYPLVKIGFNQFWMSKSLRARHYTDGSSISCYNDPTEVRRVSYPDDDATAVGPGFLYPSYPDIGMKDQNVSDRVSLWDNLGHSDVKRKGVSLYYNYLALNEDKFLAKNYYTNQTNYIPTIDDVTEMVRYVGWCFIPKLTTRKCDIAQNDGSYLQYGSPLNCAIEGAFNATDQFCANVSGLNLRAEAFRGTYMQAHALIGHTAGLILKHRATDPIIYALTVATYNRWLTQGQMDNLTVDEIWNCKSPILQTKIFAPARFCYKYKNQNYADSWHGGTAAPARKPQGRSRTVRVAVE